MLWEYTQFNVRETNIWKRKNLIFKKYNNCRAIKFNHINTHAIYWNVYIELFFFFTNAGETRWVWFCLDYFSDFLYVLDIIFHIRTGYLEDGVLQTDATKLRNHYTNSTTFYIDILCLLPLDFLYLSIGFNSMLRSFRLVKIYR